MREIKFRTFVKGSEEMVYGRVAMSVRTFTPNYRWYASEVEVMQYTGLKDINGTEIYEGDILLWDEAEWGCINREVVAWDYDQFYTRRNDWPRWCEVVGNIYENPELTRNRER